MVIEIVALEVSGAMAAAAGSGGRWAWQSCGASCGVVVAFCLSDLCAQQRFGHGTINTQASVGIAVEMESAYQVRVRKRRHTPASAQRSPSMARWHAGRARQNREEHVR